MSDVRTEPLTPEEIATYHEQGFLLPIRVLDDAQVEELREALDDHLEGRRQSADLRADRPDHRQQPEPGDRGLGSRDAVMEQTEVEKKPHSVPFLFNLWERDERFWKVDANPVIAGMARQLLGSKEVVLMEDGAVIKKPVVGGKLSWHQDFAYWPLASPGAVTCWIALDDVGAANGAMQVAAGSHKLGEKLPVEFGDGSSFMHDERPGIEELRPPEEVGLEVVGYSSRRASAASTTRCSGTPPGPTRARTRAAASSRATSPAGRCGSERFASPTTTATRSSSARPGSRSTGPTSRESTPPSELHAYGTSAVTAPSRAASSRCTSLPRPPCRPRSEGSCEASPPGARPRRVRPSRGSMRRRRDRPPRSRPRRP